MARSGSLSRVGGAEPRTPGEQIARKLCRRSRCFRFCTIPIPGAAQAFFEFDARIVGEFLARERDIGLGIADVALPRFDVYRVSGTTGEFFEQLQRVIQRIAAARSTVKGNSGYAGGFARTNVQLDDVLDESEITGLLAIAEDLRGPAIAQSRGKQ